MSALVIGSPSRNPDLINKTTQELYRELAACLTSTAKSLLQMATIWKELEARGEDLSHYREGVTKWLPYIAEGKLLAESVLTYAGRDQILFRLTEVPLELQHELINGKKLPVFLDSGEQTKMTLLEMPNKLVGRVIQNGAVQSVQKQKLVAAVQSSGSLTKEARKRKPRIVVNKQNRTITIGNTVVEVDQVLRALSTAAGVGAEIIETPGRPAPVLAAKFTEEESDKIRDIARESNRNLQDLVRSAVLAALLV